MTPAEKIEALEKAFVETCLASRQPVDKAIRLRTALRRRAKELSQIAGLGLDPKEWDELSLRVLVAIENADEPRARRRRFFRRPRGGLPLLLTLAAVAATFGYAVWFELFGRLSLDFVYVPRAEECASASPPPACAATERRR